MHYPRSYPKGPKPEILIPPPIPDYSIESETATSGTGPHLVAVQRELEKIGNFPAAKLAEIEVPPERKASLNKLDKAADDMKMPEK